jgi:hypothetical protein
LSGPSWSLQLNYYITRNTHFFQKGLNSFFWNGNLYFSVEPAMIRSRTTELAGLMGVKVRVTPSKGGSLTVLNFIFTPFGKKDKGGRCVRMSERDNVKKKEDRRIPPFKCQWNQ